ncbi:MAG: RagB/SusD family nutrient uptake outer membrane protein [Gemmatimonadota bacterium]
MRRLSRNLLVTTAFFAAACTNFLDTNPPDALPDQLAITSPAGARAALAGAYNALQSGSYYGGDFMFFNDLYGDNALHTGTFSTYGDAGAHQFRADNQTVDDIWNAIYEAIKRDNLLIEKVPNVAGLPSAERDQILGEAYFLRGLNYHNLVKLYGGVPLVVTPVKRPEDAASLTRSSAADVYTQIVADLKQAEQLMSSDSPTNHATVAAAKALLARVYLYRGDNANALAKANEVVALGFSLALDYSDLFDADGKDTPEDIFKVTFTAQQFTNAGYYWQSTDDGGRAELGPTQSLIDAYDPADLRGQWNIKGTEAGSASGTKWPTAIGAEDFPGIRFAEVLLIKAEALARLGQLPEAVATYNDIRVRAGLAPHELGVDVTTQQQVLDAIDRERRLELAEEGDRFADLVRSGRAVTVLGVPAFKLLFPIPQAEINVAPGIVQNPGY